MASIISGQYTITTPNVGGAWHVFSPAGTITESGNITPTDWFSFPVGGAESMMFQWGSYIVSKNTAAPALGGAGVRLHLLPLGMVTEDDDLMSRPAVTRANYSLTAGGSEDGNIQGHALGLVKYRESGASGEPYIVHGIATPTIYEVTEDVLMDQGDTDFTADTYHGGIFELTKKTYNTSAWPGAAGAQYPTPFLVSGLKKIWLAVIIYTPSYSGTFTNVVFDFKLSNGGK